MQRSTRCECKAPAAVHLCAVCELLRGARAMREQHPCQRLTRRSQRARSGRCMLYSLPLRSRQVRHTLVHPSACRDAREALSAPRRTGTRTPSHALSIAAQSATKSSADRHKKRVALGTAAKKRAAVQRAAARRFAPCARRVHRTVYSKQ